MSKMALGYIALTRGTKPRTGVEFTRASGFQQQRLAIRLTAGPMGYDDIQWYWDHSTYPRADFLRKDQFYEAVKCASKEEMPLFVFDFASIFARVPLDAAVRRIEEIKATGVRVFDTKDPVLITSLSVQALGELHARAVRARTLKKIASEQGKKESLASERKATAHDTTYARRHAGRRAAIEAQRFAERMRQTVEAVIEQLSTVSFASIARELNGRGHRTRRGRPWRAQSVKRVLKRLEIDINV